MDILKHFMFYNFFQEIHTSKSDILNTKTYYTYTNQIELIELNKYVDQIAGAAMVQSQKKYNDIFRKIPDHFRHILHWLYFSLFLINIMALIPIIGGIIFPPSKAKEQPVMVSLSSYILIMTINIIKLFIAVPTTLISMRNLKKNNYISLYKLKKIFIYHIFLLIIILTTLIRDMLELLHFNTLFSTLTLIPVEPNWWLDMLGCILLFNHACTVIVNSIFIETLYKLIYII